MPAKKTTPAKRPKPLTRTRRIGLTSAIGAKATTAVVIVVMAGGIFVGARQLRARTEQAPETTREMSADVAPARDAVVPARSTSGTRTKPASPAALVEHASVGSPAGERDAARAQPAMTTIAGCLERSGETFRLKDATGNNAPKARSWKSGFLKKNAATLDVVGTGAMGLSDEVGHRVRLTGTLVDRELHVRSLRRMASSCN